MKKSTLRSTSKRPFSFVARPALLTLAVATLAGATPVHAQYGLVMEPVINAVAYDPTDTSWWPLTGFLAEPGQVFTYAAGYPRDPVHDSVNISNDTTNTITGMALRIVGTANATEEPWILNVGARTEATFGDVTGDRRISSDIFHHVRVSRDGKFILLTGGAIPPGGRFTDISLSELTRVRGCRLNSPRIEYVAIESSFLAGNYFPGDVNGDGTVSHADYELSLALARGARAATPCEIAAGDLNNSGGIDMGDIHAIRALIDGKTHKSESDHD